jgi:hypothetical protein
VSSRVPQWLQRESEWRTRSLHLGQYFFFRCFIHYLRTAPSSSSFLLPGLKNAIQNGSAANQTNLNGRLPGCARYLRTAPQTEDISVSHSVTFRGPVEDKHLFCERACPIIVQTSERLNTLAKIMPRAKTPLNEKS